MVLTTASPPDLTQGLGPPLKGGFTQSNDARKDRVGDPFLPPGKSEP